MFDCLHVCACFAMGVCLCVCVCECVFDCLFVVECL